MHSTVQEKDGKLVIIDAPQTEWSNPIAYQAIWPTGIPSKDYPNFIGMTCHYYDAGTYRIETGVLLKLEYGGETKSIGSIEKPISKPKGCKVYRDGQWRKF